MKLMSDKDAKKSARVMQAMMKMVKIDIEGPPGGSGGLTAGRAEACNRRYGQPGITFTPRAISASSFPGSVTTRSTSAMDGTPPLLVQVAVPVTGPATVASTLRVGHGDAGPVDADSRKKPAAA